MKFSPDLAVLLVLGAFAPLSSILRAQSPAATSPAHKPLDPAVAALLDKVAGNRGFAPGVKKRSLVATGSYAVSFEGTSEPVARGTFAEHFAGVDRVRHVSDMGGMGVMEKGISGDVVWEVDPHMGAKVLTGANAAASRRYFAMLRGDDPRTLYRTISKAGSSTIDGREHVVLRMEPEDGKPDSWLIDADGNVVRIDTALPAPESADAAFGMADLMDAQISFARWESVDGGRFPLVRTLRMGSANIQFTAEKVTVGGEIDAGKFSPPKSVANRKRDPVGPAFGPDGKPNYQVIDKQVQPVASIRVRIKPTKVAEELAILLPEVMTHLNATGAKVAGAPFARFHARSADEIDLEAGIPVQTPITEKGRVKNSQLPAGKVVMCWHVGAYEGLAAAHATLRAYLVEQKLKERGGPWEVFWTDPGMVPDPAKWKTQLFAPIE